ncbi:unnamed protein product [Anisakis simplex]|uniref:ATP synthase subunit s, mitochondrial (inferred by orthology to a human protein) n=1 Tax=Anisakis simplex TaxID=6269 RepID=A0A0M3J6H6_ANISI|nr:unnamed protein product [Anisakis simplex]
MRMLILDRLRRAIGAHDLPGLRGLLEGFNYYDHGRVKEVGADVAAAEWIVRCEGKVRSVDGATFKLFISSFIRHE